MPPACEQKQQRHQAGEHTGKWCDVMSWCVVYHRAGCGLRCGCLVWPEVLLCVVRGTPECGAESSSSSGLVAQVGHT